VENFRIGFEELLVATDVEVHRQIRLHL